MSDDRSAFIVREMGYSVREFAGVLPSAMRDWRVDGGSDGWQVSDPDGAVIASIRISPQHERRMGSLSLPVLAVTIDLGGTTLEQAAEFMRRFERGFHRGGG